MLKKQNLLRWKSRIQRGLVKLNGQVATDPQILLRPSDTLVYFRAPWQEPDVPNYVDVLYEDEHMVRRVCLS